MTPDVLVALELLSKAVWYAANDAEHSNFELKQLDILLEMTFDNRMTPSEKHAVRKLRDDLATEANK